MFTGHKNGMNITFFTNYIVLLLDTGNKYHWKVEFNINGAQSESFGFGRTF